MPIKFHTKHSPDILMFDDIAVQLIKAMGHSGTVPGSIAPENVPAALQRLQQAVAAAGNEAGTAAPAPNDEDDEVRVSLSHRALPLIDLLKTAAADKTYVMWDK